MNVNYTINQEREYLTPAQLSTDPIFQTNGVPVDFSYIPEPNVHMQTTWTHTTSTNGESKTCLLCKRIPSDQAVGNTGTFRPTALRILTNNMAVQLEELGSHLSVADICKNCTSEDGNQHWSSRFELQQLVQPLQRLERAARAFLERLANISAVWSIGGRDYDFDGSLVPVEQGDIHSETVTSGSYGSEDFLDSTADPGENVTSSDRQDVDYSPIVVETKNKGKRGRKKGSRNKGCDGSHVPVRQGDIQSETATSGSYRSEVFVDSTADLREIVTSSDKQDVEYSPIVVETKKKGTRGRKKGSRNKGLTEKLGTENTNENVELKQLNDSSIFKCHICEKVLSGPTHLKNHILIHTSEKPHECKICSKRFRHIPSLFLHNKLHEGIRPYKCSVCEKGFVTKWKKDTHEATHTTLANREHSFLCQYCSKSFTKSMHLNRHLLTHPEARDPEGRYGPDRISKCPNCAKEFISETGLREHVINAHEPENKKFVCAEDNCGRRFCNARLLHRHKRHVHDKVPRKSNSKKHACTACDKKFCRAMELMRHMQQHTKTQKPKISKMEENMANRKANLIKLKKRYLQKFEEDADANLLAENGITQDLKIKVEELNTTDWYILGN